MIQKAKRLTASAVSRVGERYSDRSAAAATMEAAN